VVLARRAPGDRPDGSVERAFRVAFEHGGSFAWEQERRRVHERRSA
jgi:hypothetical protein